MVSIRYVGLLAFLKLITIKKMSDKGNQKKFLKCGVLVAIHKTYKLSLNENLQANLRSVSYLERE